MLSETSIPHCQFGNLDILPLQSVKTDGKSNPKVNGLLVQGVSLLRKRSFEDAGTTLDQKRRKLTWKLPSVHRMPTQFGGNFLSPKHSKTVHCFAARAAVL